MLKVDLLPAHYTVARRNKKVIILSIPMLVGVGLAWLLVMVSMNSTIAKIQAEYDDTKTQADVVRKLQGETEAKKGELAPIQAKVDFILAADKSGGQFWERFHQINRYIYDRALVTSFSITPPDSVSFNVTLDTTEDAGRFILNLIRCPYITGISISGSPSQGGQIQGLGGTAAAGAPGGGGPEGMPGGPPGAMPGAPGAPPGMPGGAPGGGAPAPSGPGPITFSVTAKLVQPLSIPTPPSAGGGGGAAGPEGMPGGPPGAPGGPPGGPGGPPGAGPGGPPGGPGGPGGAPPPPAGPKGGGDDD